MLIEIWCQTFALLGAKRLSRQANGGFCRRVSSPEGRDLGRVTWRRPMGARTQAQRSINGKSPAQRENGDGRGSGGLPPVAPSGAVAKRRGVEGPLGHQKRPLAAVFFACPERGSNPHVFKGHWILSPARLPIPPSGLFSVLQRYPKIANNQIFKRFVG